MTDDIESGEVATEHQTESPQAKKLREELIAMTETQPGSNEARRSEAMQAYAGYGAEYQKRNNKRVEAANTPGHQKIKIDTFGDGAVTMVAQINTEKSYAQEDVKMQSPLHDPESGDLIEGMVIDDHDYTPEAQTMEETEQALQQYLANTPPEQQLIIYEGLEATDVQLADRTSAIEARTDSGLVQYHARQKGIEARPGEADIKQETLDFIESGVSKELAITFYTLRSLAIRNKSEEAGLIPADLTMHLYAELARRGIDDFIEIPEDEKQQYLDHPELLAPIKARVVESMRSGLDEINQVFVGSNLPELIVHPDGSMGFDGPVTSAELMHRMDPSGDAALSEISRNNIKLRDTHIFATIADAVKEGKRPFVEYGGSHVVSLEPVMEKYFGNRVSVSLH